MYKHTSTIGACLVSLAVGVPAHAAADATGVWIDHTGRGGVEITECAGNLCGRVVWLKEGTDKRGCGIQIIGNVKPVGKDTWDGGWIIDPEKNEKYSVELKPVGSDKLRVVGYMGSKLFSETMTWKRAPTDLKRCDIASTESDTTVTPLPKADPVPKGVSTPKKGAGTGCTKYFPQIGQMVDVPCPR